MQVALAEGKVTTPRAFHNARTFLGDMPVFEPVSDVSEMQ